MSVFVLLVTMNLSALSIPDLYVSVYKTEQQCKDKMAYAVQRTIEKNLKSNYTYRCLEQKLD